VARLAMTLVSPGGTLLACSCSGLVSPELFQQILFAAALDAGRSFSITEKAGAGPDHPVSIYCPESEYLKAFYLRAGG
jgi:23S rRNA (cytosine1962-C5)-methyltransferase